MSPKNKQNGFNRRQELEIWLCPFVFLLLLPLMLNSMTYNIAGSTAFFQFTISFTSQNMAFSSLASFYFCDHCSIIGCLASFLLASKISPSIYQYRISEQMNLLVIYPNNSLRTIRLSQIQLGGTLSPSLEYCKNLEVLDVSENELEGNFPYGLETRPILQELVPRSNKFIGPFDSFNGIRDPYQITCFMIHCQSSTLLN